MIGRFFAVHGYNISSLIIDRISLKFSRKSFNSTRKFNKWWNNNIALSSKKEIEYDSIRSITKEEDDDEVTIFYRSFNIVPNVCRFSFDNQSDITIFFDFLTKEKNFQQSSATSTPFQAIKGYLKGLMITIILSAFFYILASPFSAVGTIYEAKNENEELFLEVLGMVGVEGILLIGTAVSLYILYRIVSRLNHLPTLITLIPPEHSR